MIKTSISALLFATCVACQGGETAEPSKQQPDADALLKEMLASFEEEGIQLDGKAGTVTIKATVNHPSDPIEYLLIHRRGKKHEAVFWTTAKPSLLNAALLTIGLEKGKNATYVEKDPAPTLEEVRSGVDPLIVTPPKGKPFWMTVKWKVDGKVVEHCVEDLLLDLTTQKPLGECSWVYLGGRTAQIYKGDPEVYIADFEGNLISVCYLTPDNHLGTMVHERARDDQNWWMTDKVPEPGTEVEFVFHKAEPVLHVERQKRLRAEQARKQAATKGAPGDGKKN